MIRAAVRQSSARRLFRRGTGWRRAAIGLPAAGGSRGRAGARVHQPAGRWVIPCRVVVRQHGGGARTAPPPGPRFPLNEASGGAKLCDRPFGRSRRGARRVARTGSVTRNESAIRISKTSSPSTARLAHKRAAPAARILSNPIDHSVTFRKAYGGRLGMRTFAPRIIVGVAWLALWPVIASAQTSTIAGTVKDSSGALLPGVTVEAASPAPIQKGPTATTDGSGQYQITALRPGTYNVTFTLPGFSTVKHEGIELTSDFTAQVNADLKVGAIGETITVTGESPVVDTQNITTRTVMTRAVLDSIPTGRNIHPVRTMLPPPPLP